MDKLRLQLRPFFAGLAALGLALGLAAPLAGLGAYSVVLSANPTPAR